MPVSAKPRPTDPIEEWELSRLDRRVELQQIVGLGGVREIRRRLALVTTMKQRSLGRDLSGEELARVGPAIDARIRRRDHARRARR